MARKQDGAPRPTGLSRSNKRIQDLEEKVAGLAKELRQINELLGTKVDTKELMSLIGKQVSVKDVCKATHVGTLEKVGKWTITVSGLIFFKGNLIHISLAGGEDEH